MSSAFWSGFASSAFSVGTKGYGGVTGRTLIMATVGGTVSQLTGGKFANGAVTGAFVHLFNAERVLESRKAYIENRAIMIARDPNISDEYRMKLLSLMIEDKLLYEENAWRTTKVGLEHVFGTADIKSGIVRLTSRIWTHHNSHMLTVNSQIGHTLLHEVKHLLIETGSHPGGRYKFDDDIRAMGY
jgi:hypothetical protein